MLREGAWIAKTHIYDIIIMNNIWRKFYVILNKWSLRFTKVNKLFRKRWTISWRHIGKKYLITVFFFCIFCSVSYRWISRFCLLLPRQMVNKTIILSLFLLWVYFIRLSWISLEWMIFVGSFIVSWFLSSFIGFISKEKVLFFVNFSFT